MAKRVRRNVSFQIKTAQAALRPTVIAVSLMTLAAALPAVLLLVKQRDPEPMPYLVIDISGAPESIAPAAPQGSLPPSP